MTHTKFCTLFGAALLLLPMALLSPVMAQDVRPVPASAVVGTGLTVTGHADLMVKPDIATLTIGVTTQARQQDDAAQANATKLTAVLNALRQAGVADKDIQTSGYDIQPQYNEQRSPPVLTGYQVDNTVTVTIRDLSKAGAVIDAATQAGATNIGDLSFDLADRTAAEQQALAQAVTEARAKAEAMAQAAGVTRGPLLSLTEGTPAVVQPFVMARAFAPAAAPPPATPVQSDQITITADVTAVYALGQ